MTDFQLLIEFCDRFGYAYRIYELDDSECFVVAQGEEYYFDSDGMLVE